jgi:hypothetical protein
MVIVAFEFCSMTQRPLSPSWTLLAAKRITSANCGVARLGKILPVTSIFAQRIPPLLRERPVKLGHEYAFCGGTAQVPRNLTKSLLKSPRRTAAAEWATIVHTVSPAAHARRALDCGVDGKPAAMLEAPLRPCRSFLPWSMPVAFSGRRRRSNCR